MNAVRNISAVCPQKESVAMVENTRFWTDAKIKQVALGALAGVALVGAVAATALTFTVTPWFLAAATPLYLTAGALAWKAMHIIDYDNPQKLAQIREEAQRMPLSKIVEKHGWQRIFRYAILSPLDFIAAYRAHVGGLSLNDSFVAYRMISKEICRAALQDQYPLPSPSEWADKLVSETHGYNFSRLINDYQLGDLIAYDLLSSQKFNASFQKYIEIASFADLVQCYKKGKMQIGQAFSSCNAKVVQELHLVISDKTWKQKFDVEYGQKKASEIVSQIGHELSFLLEHNVVSQKKYDVLVKARNEIDFTHQRIEEAEKEMHQRLKAFAEIRRQSEVLADRMYAANAAHAQIAHLRARERDERKAMQNRFDADMHARPELAESLLSAKRDAVRLLERGFEMQRSPYEDLLHSAWQLRNLAFLSAEREFYAIQDALQHKMKADTARMTVMRDAALEAIDREYQSL